MARISGEFSGWRLTEKPHDDRLDKFGKHIYGGISVSSIREMHYFLGFSSVKIGCSCGAYVTRRGLPPVRNLPFPDLR